MTCIISVFTLRTCVPCFSAAQTVQRVFNVATRGSRGTELASLGPLPRWLGWKLRRLPESTLSTEAKLSCANAATSFSAASAPRATFSAASKVCSSASSFFCVSLLRRPHTKQSRKASFQRVPNSVGSWSQMFRVSSERCDTLAFAFCSSVESVSFGDNQFFRTCEMIL